MLDLSWYTLFLSFFLSFFPLLRPYIVCSGTCSSQLFVRAQFSVFYAVSAQQCGIQGLTIPTNPISFGNLVINTMLCLLKVNSNTIIFILHTSCNSIQAYSVLSNSSQHMLLAHLQLKNIQDHNNAITKFEPKSPWTELRRANLKATPPPIFFFLF